MNWYGKKWNGKQQPSCGEEYQTGFSSVFYVVKVIRSTHYTQKKIIKKKKKKIELWGENELKKK